MSYDADLEAVRRHAERTNRPRVIVEVRCGLRHGDGTARRGLAQVLRIHNRPLYVALAFDAEHTEAWVGLKSLASRSGGTTAHVRPHASWFYSLLDADDAEQLPAFCDRHGPLTIARLPLAAAAQRAWSDPRPLEMTHSPDSGL